MQVKKDLHIGLDIEQLWLFQLWFGSKSGKEYIKAVYCHPAYLTSMQSTSWETLGWMKHKLESRLLAEISVTSDMQITGPLWQKAKKNQRAFDGSERGEWKLALKLNIQKTEIITSSPITSWQIDGETMEIVADYFGEPQNHCRWWPQPWFFFF